MVDGRDLLRDAFASFRPAFKSLEDDGRRFAVHLERMAAQAVPEGDSLGLAALHRSRGPIFDRLVALHFAHGRRDLVEAHYCIDEWGAGLPDRAMRARFHRFAAMGQGPSALRCWQHYIRKNATMYWQDVRDRDAAAKRRDKSPELHAAYAFHARSLERTKRLTLEAIALARRHFDAAGSDRDRDWLARMRREVEAETRARLAAKPLPDDMNERLFWDLLGAGGATAAERLDTLPERLAAYSAPAIKAFGQMATDRMAAAYREDIWALAYLLMGGCSDDAFDYFRAWLLLQGQDTYRAVLSDPDAFDPATLAGRPLAEGLMGAVEQAHVMRSGKDLPRLKAPKARRIEPREDDFAVMLPKLAEKLR